VIKKTRVDAIYGLVSLMDAALAAAPAFDARALILYGQRDEIVPPGAVKRFIRALPEEARERQRIALYDDGFHLLLRDLRGPEVLGDIAEWVLDSEAPLPSGAGRRGAAWRAAAPR
jgi:alpha-beta hydrolase superfamily lysophospholipase